MAVILISGQPGTGKTTFAKDICHGRDILLLSTDVIKSFYRICQVGKYSRCDSHDAWKIVGRRSAKNIIQGFISHASQFEDMAAALIGESVRAYRHIVLEGVHVLPSLYDRVPGEKYAYYIDIPTRRQHWELFDKKNRARSQFNCAWYENYEEITIINEFARAECEKSGFKIIKQKDFEKVKNNILRKLKI